MAAVHRESMAARTHLWRADHQLISCARWVGRTHTLQVRTTLFFYSSGPSYPDMASSARDGLSPELRFTQTERGRAVVGTKSYKMVFSVGGHLSSNSYTDSQCGHDRVCRGEWGIRKTTDGMFLLFMDYLSFGGETLRKMDDFMQIELIAASAGAKVVALTQEGPGELSNRVPDPHTSFRRTCRKME